MRLFLFPILLLLTFSIQAQSKWEHGIGLGITLSDFKESYKSQQEEIPNLDGSVLNTSIQFWNAYSFTDKFSISLSPGFSWKGAKTNYSGKLYDGAYFDWPLVFHYEVLPKLNVSNGLAYQYLINFGDQSDRDFYNLTGQVENKHLISWSTGITYNLFKWLDFNLNFSQSFTTVYNLDVKDFNNRDVGNVDLKNKAFQFIAIFKH